MAAMPTTTASPPSLPLSYDHSLTHTHTQAQREREGGSDTKALEVRARASAWVFDWGPHRNTADKESKTQVYREAHRKKSERGWTRWWWWWWW